MEKPLKRYFSFLVVVAVMFLAAMTTACDSTTPINKEKQEFTVTFETGDGGSTVSSQKVKEGEKVIKPADPTKADETFSGWFSEPFLLKEWDFDLPVAADLTLYAKWLRFSPPEWILGVWGREGNNYKFTPEDVVYTNNLESFSMSEYKETKKTDEIYELFNGNNRRYKFSKGDGTYINLTLIVGPIDFAPERLPKM